MSAIRDRTSEGFTRDRLRLELTRASRPFLVVLVLVGVGVVSIAMLLARLDLTLPWQDPYEIRVAVDDASGVVAKSHDILISGVVVGKITDVALERGRPVLTARIDDEHGRLYRDARLRLRPRTPLEDMYLNVEHRGTPAAGQVPSGGLISAARTRSPVHIGAVLDVFNADVRPRIGQAIDNAGRGLGDHGDEFRAALVELAPFLDSAKRFAHEYAIRRQRTRRVIHNFRRVTEELARRDGQVTRLVRAGSQALGELGSVDRPLSQLIAQMPPTLRQLPRSFAVLRATADELDPAFTALRPAARAMPAGLRALKRFGPDLRAGASALRRPMPRLTGLMRATRPLADDFSEAFARLRPQMPRLDRVTAALVPCKLAIQKFFNWTLSVGKYYDVHGAVPRGQSVLGVTGLTGGDTRDPELTDKPTCAKGAPRK